MDTFGGNTGSPVPYYNPNAAMQIPGGTSNNPAPAGNGGGQAPVKTSAGTTSSIPAWQQPTPPAPTLSAGFNQPAQGTKAAPAVVTAQAAADHVGEMTTAAQTAAADAQNLAAHTANVNATKAASIAPTPVPGTSTDTGTQASPYDEQINSILGDLATNESTTASASPQDQTIIDQDNAQITADNAAQQQVGDSIDQMNAGSFPLTPGEQLQVTNVGKQYDAALKAAQLYAINLAAGAVVQGAQSKMQMYSPQTALSNIQNAINAGAIKINDVNTRMSNAMSKLTTALQNADYKTATQLYKSISDDIKLRTDEVGKINTSVLDATKQMHTDALNVAKEQISGVKLDITQKQNVINNLYKQGTLTERQRHDMQTEAVQTEREARLAANGSPAGGGGKPIKSGARTFNVAEIGQIGSYLNNGGTIDGQNYASRGEDGYIDPGVYSALADWWQGQGGTLKDFLSHWPAKYYINPDAQVPPWMSTASSKVTL